MQIFGIDPGFNYTGVAMVDFLLDDRGRPDWVSATIDGAQFWDPQEAMRWVVCRGNLAWGDRAYVVEGFVGSGHLTKEAKETLLVLGYFQYGLPDKPYIQVPQARLSRVREATAVLEEMYPETAKPLLKDAVAALAHAYAYTHLAYGE